MTEIDPAIREIVGDIDYDKAELRRRYAYERDVRLRPDRNRQYIETEAQFSHYADDPYVEPTERAPLTDHVEIAIVGGGMGGLMVGARLRQAGFEDIRIIEKGGDFGGTWYWNRYPGIRCDTEAYVYIPMIEETGSFPSEKYSRGSEIRDHLLRIARQYDLYRNACLQTGVTGMAWDEASQHWVIRTDRQDRMTARYVVLSNGLLVKPKLPGIPGIDLFKGHTFHTSRWDYAYTGGDETGGLVGLSDKRVGVVGTGATGVQVIPHLGAWARELFVFQRTPAAVDYRSNRPTDPEWIAALEPGWQKQRVDNFNHVTTGRPQPVDLVNDRFSATGRLRDAAWAAALVGRSLTPDEQNLITETLDDKMMNFLRARIDADVHDPATAEALKPWHRRWCKRPLFSDDYLSTFNRRGVTLVDTSGKGIERMTQDAVIVAGREYPIDCLIFATGFETGTEYTHRAGYDVVGRDGLELSDYWKDGMKTFHGMFTRGFPNCFIMGSGQGASAVAYSFPLQEQAKHVAHVVAEAERRGASSVEPSAAAVQAYLDEVKPMSLSQQKFWLDCTPSYMNDEGASGNRHGFYANAHPAGTVDFYRMLAAWRDRNILSELEFR
ncbi:MAG: monooxygenase [Acidobacteria bacterium]|nr:monooxygenase [Acidobacteriota bacterium]